MFDSMAALLTFFFFKKKSIGTDLESSMAGRRFTFCSRRYMY